MGLRTEVLEIDGIHCMRCVQTLADALAGVPDLAAASATLAGEVRLSYEQDDTRAAAVAAIEAAGFEVSGSRTA
jgi:copper chaperone CopZ